MAYNKIRKDGSPAQKPGRKPNPNKKVSPGQGKGRKGPRPHTWIIGPDEYKHSMYLPWLRAKAQAKFRGEDWNLTFDEFYDLWKDEWNNRGRAAEQMCMSRKDSDAAWDNTNSIIVTRHEHLINQAKTRAPRGKAKCRR